MLNDQSLTGYMTYLEEARRVTPASLKNYRSTCTRFLKWADQNGRTLDSDSVIEFLKSYDHAASANTALVRLNGLASFLDVALSKVPRAKEEIGEVEALGSNDVEALVTAAESIDPALGAAVRFLAETGLRFSEFREVNRSMIRTSSTGRKYLLIRGKGRKVRKVPMSPAAYRALENLPVNRHTYYFETKFRNTLARAGRIAKIRYHVHPHLLRATFISSMLNDRRVDSAIVAKIVGHASVDTLVKHYFCESIDTLSDAMYDDTAA